LTRRIDAKRDELIALTVDLVRIPTINPPGDVYTDCAEYVGRRLKQRGFDIEYVRAEGVRGDSARYPRTNVIGASHRRRRPGPCVHFNSHIDVVEAGSGGASIRSPASS
jgi:succinyl-diaminopimelate desuccinylase